MEHMYKKVWTFSFKCGKMYRKIATLWLYFSVLPPKEEL